MESIEFKNKKYKLNVKIKNISNLLLLSNNFERIEKTLNSKNDILTKIKNDLKDKNIKDNDQRKIEEFVEQSPELVDDFYKIQKLDNKLLLLFIEKLNILVEKGVGDYDVILNEYTMDNNDFLTLLTTIENFKTVKKKTTM